MVKGAPEIVEAAVVVKALTVTMHALGTTIPVAIVIVIAPVLTTESQAQ